MSPWGWVTLRGGVRVPRFPRAPTPRSGRGGGGLGGRDAPGGGGGAGDPPPRFPVGGSRRPSPPPRLPPSIPPVGPPPPPQRGGVGGWRGGAGGLRSARRTATTQRGRRGRPRRGPQLYDTPYEEWEAAADGPGAGGSRESRESRLPRDDERPADEYDQPWEWKKDHISRAFAVQFESPERSPSLSRQLPRSPRPPPGTGCPPSPRHVDTSLPLEKQVWYHGPIGRAGAETLLALCREGSFLVRDCETSPEDYSLSLRSSHGFVHVKLTRTREHHFTLGRAGAAFPSVPAAVRHYTARALPVRGARHLSLLYPVAVQPL
uniref:Src homology 2 domain containing transforming protein D n=1 Tax=Amazona collaria TaxID=241587 RepID=A0A8B9GKX9_9PSIT